MLHVQGLHSVINAIGSMKFVLMQFVAMQFVAMQFVVMQFVAMQL